MLTNEILSSIDNIDDCIMEAEMNVLTAMINEYDKAIMIMENYNGNDYSSFDIFMEADELYQEGKIGRALDKIDSKLQKKDGESIIKSILLALPRLIMKLINYIRDKFNKRRLDKCAEDISDIIDGLDDLFDDNDGPVQEGFFSSKTKTKTTSLDELDSSDSLGKKSSNMSNDLTNEFVNKVVDISNDLQNVDVNDKQSIKKLIIKTISTISPSRAAMEENLKLVKKGIEIIRSFKKDKLNNIVSRDIEKAQTEEETSAAMEELGEYIEQNFDRLFYRLASWEADVLNRHGSFDRIKEYQDKGETKKALKETLYLLSGLGDFAFRLYNDPAFYVQVSMDIANSLDKIIKKLDEMEFTERTNNTKSKIIKMMNIMSKTVVSLQKLLMGIDSELNKVMSAVSKIKNLFMKL